MFFLEHIWIVPLLPASGAAMMFFFGRAASRGQGQAAGHHPAHTPAGSAPAEAHAPERHGFVNAICVGAVVLAFVWSVLAVWQYTNFAAANHGAPFEKVMYTWLGSDTGALTIPGHGDQPVEVKAEAGFLVDPLSSIWLLFVTGVGMLIHIYSTGYMAHEGGYYRFFGYLNLFMFSMLTLILGNNYAMLFVGWEGVGVCSYLLIGFYFQRHSASTAANKAFIVNRIGDAAFLLGMFTIIWYTGSLRFTSVIHAARSGQFSAGDPILTGATLLLLIGACGKSAQIPLYIWLPDAMEGPTPVSALIHAATMVTAGVYMVTRSNSLFILAPETMKIMAIIGALTAFFAATIGLVQNDIKRVLAYSTVSQLGYMFLALGVGAFAAGVFHVFTHAFFKALLFLGAGSVIHAMSGEQDMRNMGALAGKIPITFRTMLIATLAIAGIPGLAGFFSKDEILWQTWLWPHDPYHIFWVIGWATAFMTAFYMFRLVYLTFWSPSRMSHDAEHHVHESPRSMTVPLMILAFCSIFAGYLGLPHSLGGSNRFEKFLEPVFASGQVEGEAGHSAAAAAGEAAHSGSTEYVLMLLSVGVAVAGWLLAKKFYGRAGKGYTEPIAQAAPPVYTLLYNKYYVDEAYDYVFTGRKPIGNTRLGVMGAGNALWDFDANVIDGAVNGAGWLTRRWGSIASWWDKWVIDGLLVNGPAYATIPLSWFARLTQWGLVQWYALVMVAGLIGFVFYYLANRTL
ncbi:MAG TPA: NADH-quinone oxidoreductase subunit L [Terriglobales bacterium]|nr:NADH-quinone oxidoreductase subunit L [Terriglobales bacterium]